tara:strand:+ start:58 stop:1422 length:1365 start_codon:yes stop_codon:yes gene_type:complete
MTSRPEHVIVDELDPNHSPLPIPKPTIEDVSETLLEAKDTHTGAMLGGSVLGEYLPLPKGTGAVVGGAIGYGISKLKRETFGRISNQLDNWLSGKDFSLFNKNVEANRSYTVDSPISTITEAFKGGPQVGTAMDVSGTPFRHSILNKTNRGLYKQLKDQDPKLIDEAENIIKELDAFKTSEGSSQQFANWNPNRPTTGFQGKRTVKYIDKSGNPSEVAFRWSASNRTYVPYDLVKRQNTILKRMRWNVNRSPKAKWYADKVYKSAREDNAVLRQLLTELRQENPQRYFDIMGDTKNYAENKGFIFVEHIHAQNSPYWKYVSKGQFKPRDTSNLMIVKNEEFGKLKTSIENQIYNNKNFVFPEGKRLLLDYDKTRDVLVLKQLQDNNRLKRIGDISPITNPRNWKKALDAALKGHTIKTGKLGEIQQVIQGDPDLPKHVKLQHNFDENIDPRFTR